MLRLVFFFVISGLFPHDSHSTDNSFHHNVDFTTDDNGERFKLHSSGVLSDVVDLDVIDGLKRLVCVDDKILMVTTQNDVGRDWRVGQLILGSTTWRCNASQGSGGDGIYAKISSIYFPTEYRISIHVVPAGPYDMIEEANIHFRYSPGRSDLPVETKQRHRRYLSNILTKILGNLDWHANFSTRIPFNEHHNQSSAPDKYFAVHKTSGARQANVTFSPSQEDLLMLKDDFIVRCMDCHGGTDMSYVFELLIKKVNNKPKLVKYISQLEGESQLRADIEVEFSQEMGVNYTTPVWETGPIELIRIPVAVVWRLPPVELSLAYNTQALVSVFGYSRGSGRGRTGFRASGRYTISQQFEASSSLQGDITSHAWTSDGQDTVEMAVPDTFNVTVDVFQKIFFNASVSWKVKDITINLYPPMEITVRPSMKMESVISGLEVCTEATLAVDGLFSVEKSVLSVEAFGCNVWDVMLNPKITKRETLTESSLSLTCLAHCDGPAELGPPLTQDQVCGEMTDRVVRGSSLFNKFEVLEGTDIVFAAEESALCELTPSACSVCNNHSTTICASRCMTPRLARAITKLSQLVKTEWTNATLIVLAAWDEPSPAFPGGHHGNSSLHYEGRAAVVTVTGVSAANTVDNTTFDRIGSLCVCSGFDYVGINREFAVIHVAMKKDGVMNMSTERAMFEDLIADEGNDARFQRCAKEAPILNVGDTIPSGEGVDEACGPPQGALSRLNSEDMQKLYHYDRSDVVFRPEGSPSSVCGFSTRRCRTPCLPSMSQTEPWSYCSTRLMTPRMALKLRQLAKLAHADGIDVNVERAFTEQSDMPLHYREGRPLQHGNELNYITLWNTWNTTYFRQILDIQEELLQGGPVIHPFDKGICDIHPLGRVKQYLTFQFHQNGLCSTTEQPAFCKQTLPFRKEEARTLQERMTSAAGFGRLPRVDLNPDIQKCIVELCGGCPATGHLWDDKVKACSVVVDKFINRATRAFPDLTDRATFFDTETAESSVHSLACHDGNICVENIQLYSLLMPLMTSRYPTEPSGSIEVLMFSSEKNPMPLMELVEQEMAYRAAGRVRIFVDHQEDIKSLKGILKVLMVYSKNVSGVEFHVYDDLDIDLIKADVQRNLDVWAGDTCSDHSRFAISPFTFHQLSHSRRKRSLARSQHRNEARQKIFDWEMEWMMKLL
ncbi:uncharacterized protein LOC124279450 isoform X1 [Haliotis rubra]|uniref:uncharacterized protein LOC124279450 isoform X1 n=1 Tax=Haliotis rubra TaxID=36100 RepID=UPI001EE5DD41|nr:uncharacterized protein LOC124279450 isoform X1 [Haliotis rubra]